MGAHCSKNLVVFSFVEALPNRFCSVQRSRMTVMPG
jgi:hypothetical protein